MSTKAGELHYPVIWADDGVPESAAQNHRYLDIARVYYDYALNRVDRQIANLLVMLKLYGRLQNAIVIFLSDHGNGLYSGEMGRNRFGEQVYIGDTTTGHGTDITNLTQQHVVLAIRGFGRFEREPGYRDELVSLMDITPTLMQMLGIEANEPARGEPLDLLGRVPAHWRVLYFESAVFLTDLGTGQLELAEKLAKKAKFYRIRANGRLVRRTESLPQLYKHKVRAAYDGEHLLVQVIHLEKKAYRVIVINRDTGDKRPMTPETLNLPGVAEWGQAYCTHYSKHDPYFMCPVFCEALVAK